MADTNIFPNQHYHSSDCDDECPNSYNFGCLSKLESKKRYYL